MFQRFICSSFSEVQQNIVTRVTLISYEHVSQLECLTADFSFHINIGDLDGRFYRKINQTKICKLIDDDHQSALITFSASSYVEGGYKTCRSAFQPNSLQCPD